jgi:hypothetical protein
VPAPGLSLPAGKGFGCYEDGFQTSQVAIAGWLQFPAQRRIVRRRYEGIAGINAPPVSQETSSFPATLGDSDGMVEVGDQLAF